MLKNLKNRSKSLSKINTWTYESPSNKELLQKSPILRNSASIDRNLKTIEERDENEIIPSKKLNFVALIKKGFSNENFCSSEDILEILNENSKKDEILTTKSRKKNDLSLESPKISQFRNIIHSMVNASNPIMEEKPFKNRYSLKINKKLYFSPVLRPAIALEKEKQHSDNKSNLYKKSSLTNNCNNTTNTIHFDLKKKRGSLIKNNGINLDFLKDPILENSGKGTNLINKGDSIRNNNGKNLQIINNIVIIRNQCMSTLSIGQ